MSLSHSVLSISAIFVAWKSLILFIAWLAPGQGYDTSTSLLFGANRLVRWDAIYFVQKAQRGDVFEQEWAFGKGLSTLLSGIAGHELKAITMTGIIMSHLTHYLSVILLWGVAASLSTTARLGHDTSVVPFIASCLHIISPAGIFLSAPYSEAPFSCLNMLGFWLYLQAHLSPDSFVTRKCCALIMSGVSFGCATVIRSNGIFSGLPFLFDAVTLSLETLRQLTKGKLSVSRIVVLTSTVIAGTCIAIGLALTQYLAYLEYCTHDEDARPWCHNRPPLIFSFVQSHYWGVGFLRYWTLSNVPLFLLAVPILLILLWSGIESFTGELGTRTSATQTAMIQRLALPQLLLAVLAITNYHVQIITRLASGYPWLYIWLAQKITSGFRYSGVAVQFFMMYGLIQAGLFASFLPPA